MSIEQEILRIERQQVKDFNQRCLPAILHGFAPGFVGFSSTRHARIRGRRALEKTFHYYLRRGREPRYRIAQPRVQVYGNTAVATFHWTVELGAGRRVRGRGTHVFVRRRGLWRIVHEYFSRAH